MSEQSVYYISKLLSESHLISVMFIMLFAKILLYLNLPSPFSVGVGRVTCVMGGMPDRSSGDTPPPICGTQPPESAGVDVLGVPEEGISLPKWE